MLTSFKEFIVEQKKDPTSNTLHSFDLDDTLFHHGDNLRVHVNDPNGNRVQTLTNQEFNTHKLPTIIVMTLMSLDHLMYLVSQLILFIK